MEEEYLTVSILNSKLHSHITRGSFRNIYVRGEISNLYNAKSGHSYFNLKDENSTINCVTFKRVLRKSIKLKDGLNVIVKGSVEVYKQKGEYQIKVNSIKEDGQGRLFEKLQQLTEKLEGEGLFDDKHKKEIPSIPQKIGVITSHTGAAIKDIKTTIERRWPYCKIYIFPSIVQGTEAPSNLINQLKRADSFGLDTLIIGRGGGSIEDLWAFNDEQLAREVYNCKTPIISAVGHERDTTLTDYVADKRAATPTAAAEMAVPNVIEIENRYLNLKTRLENSLNKTISNNRQRLDFILRSRVISNPHSLYENKKMQFESDIYKIKNLSKKIGDSKRNELDGLTKSFKYYSETLKTSKRNKLEKLITRFQYSSEKYQDIKRKEFDLLKKDFESASNNLLFTKKTELNSLKNSHILKNPNKILTPKWQQYMRLFEKTEVVNPLNSLKRGYTITKKDNKTITTVEDLNKDDIVEIKFKDGNIKTKVI